jgi:hypothetical protein
MFPRLTSVLMLTVAMIVAMSGALADTAEASADTDHDYTSALPGVWHGEFHYAFENTPNVWIHARNEDRYFADGTVSGHSDYHSPSGVSRMRYRARWRVADGFLVVEVIEISGGFIEAGSISRDKILSLDTSTLRLLTADGETITLTRAR